MDCIYSTVLGQSQRIFAIQCHIMQSLHRCTVPNHINGNLNMMKTSTDKFHARKPHPFLLWELLSNQRHNALHSSRALPLLRIAICHILRKTHRLWA